MRDRRAQLRSGQSLLNGIDFVEVSSDQRSIIVHFLVKAPDQDALRQAVKRVTIRGGDSIPEVAVISDVAHGWSTPGDLPQLSLEVAAPGDFSTYELVIETTAPVLDPYLSRASFSFKAGCPTTLDCEQPEPVCATDTGAAPPIDYLAKDFESFKRALSDFSARSYPSWQERSEADFGVMFMEALAALGDDLSYQQDRIAAEGWLETATQRRSLVRLARLVDYEPRPATAARVELRVEVAAGTQSIPAGLAASARAPDGTVIDFETGTNLDDTRQYPVAESWNRISAYFWDEADRCLPLGATELWIEAPSEELAEGQRVLIETTVGEGELPLRQIVRLVAKPTAATDPVFGQTLRRLVWHRDDALTHERDLSQTIVAANLIPATQGRRHSEYFTTRRDLATPPGVRRAVVRDAARREPSRLDRAPERPPQFLHTLARGPLTWLAPDDPKLRPQPELRVTELGTSPRVWSFSRSLLDDAGLGRAVVTVDPIAYRQLGTVDAAADYDGEGDTLRFGDGVFGALPAEGAIFEVLYRVGAGTRGNVAAGAIDRVDPAHPSAGTITAIDNPLPAKGGEDAEPLDRIRELAPQAFRAKQYRAVRAEDYEHAAKDDLGWVQRAGTAFRYTGSWLSVFTAVDPRGSEVVPTEQLVELAQLLDRRRLAGYEAFGLGPRFAPLDLAIEVCALPDAFRGDVKESILLALDTAHFFHPDRFTFGIPLERSALESAIQRAPGVDGVVELRYRRRGHTDQFVVMPDAITVAKDEIVRVDNDPSRPERGSLSVAVVGGK